VKKSEKREKQREKPHRLRFLRSLTVVDIIEYVSGDRVQQGKYSTTTNERRESIAVSVCILRERVGYFTILGDVVSEEE